MNKSLSIVGIAFSLLTSCNWDEGACWSRAEEDGQIGGGGGPIVPGAGGFGDEPEPKPQASSDTAPPPCDLDDTTELGAVVCGPSGWGAECMIRCAESGVVCPAGQKHTKTKGMVLLYKCCACKGQQECWYADSEDKGNVCVYRPEARVLLCK